MIGIFGLYRADRSAPADAEQMTASVPGRYAVEAPAETGAVLGRVAHDLMRGGGRARSGNGRLEAVVCGEIFNMDDFADLGGAQANAADVVLGLAEADALDRLAEVNGQFCAAIYDRAGHRLTLITDRLACHPIHLWRQDGEAVFATQLYTLIGDARVPRRADPMALAQLFTMQRTVGRITPLANVTALPAACIFEIGPDGVSERSYWRLGWRKPDFTEREGGRLLAEAFRNAVGRQTRTGKVGLLLSGGVDSRLVLSAANGHPPSCWTTASYDANPELALARRLATQVGAPHHALVVPPERTLDVQDETVIASGGLYPASTSVSAFMPQVSDACDSVLTGHGIDYTLRGYYLPARFASLAGSRTRLPALRSVPRRPDGASVLRNLRQGPPQTTIERIVRQDRAEAWWRGQDDAMDTALKPWLESDEPLNAWDAFILHAVSKHYAFTSMAAVRAEVDLRIPAFDAEVFDVFLRMPPAWRCRGQMVLNALEILSPEFAAIPNANTGFRAGINPWQEVAGLLGRGALRRMGVLKRDDLPSSSHSHGSWQNMQALFRADPAHRKRFGEIRDRLDALTLGVLDADGLRACIDEHLDGAANHTKLLRQLLTHDSWVRTFGIEGNV